MLWSNVLVGLFLSVVGCVGFFDCSHQKVEEDVVYTLRVASDAGDTARFMRVEDSLQRAALERPGAYAELALAYYHRWGKCVPESMEADRYLIRLCVYHRVGMLADSAAMRGVYEAHGQGMRERIESLARGESMRATAERMIKRMDQELMRFFSEVRLSAYLLIAELELQFPGFVRDLESTRDGLLRTIHETIRMALDSIDR